MSKPLMCDCCGNQIMAIDHGDKVVIKARHHGQDHLLTIDKEVTAVEFSDERDLVSSSN